MVIATLPGIAAENRMTSAVRVRKVHQLLSGALRQVLGNFEADRHVEVARQVDLPLKVDHAKAFSWDLQEFIRHPGAVDGEHVAASLKKAAAHVPIPHPTSSTVCGA